MSRLSPTTVRDDEIAALEGQSPEAILAWAAARYAPKITFATGFGVEGCVLIHMIGRARLAIDVFTLDTGLLFPETYALWRRLEAETGVAVRAVTPAESVEAQNRTHGEALWAHDPNRCCELRKVEPLRAALVGYEAWVSAIRRAQTADRAEARVVEWDARFGLAKINPLAAWSDDEVWAYVRAHGVPYNPLHDRGYPSIGCAPCTGPVAPGEDPRAGRWRGRAKTECGLHQRLVAKGDL